MCITSLKDSQIKTTSGKNGYYRVVSGSLLLYITKIDEKERAGRKHFLCEIHERDNIKIPSLDIDDEFLGRWRFIISALDTVGIEYNQYDAEEQMNSIIQRFSKHLELTATSILDFESEIVELIERKLLSEELIIYRHKQEDMLNFREGIDAIVSVFHSQSKMKEGKTNNQLYNAVALICNHIKIHLLPYDTIVEACGRNFSLEDLSRISHFMIRPIQLEDGWYQRDSGCILAFKESVEDDYCFPVACIPSGTNKYVEYDFFEMKSEEINKDTINAYVKTAYMVYKPLQSKSLTMKDVFMFCIDAVSKKDISWLFLLTLFGSLIGLLIPYLNKLVYGKFILWGNENALLQFGGLIIAFTIGNLLFAIVKNMIVFKSTTTIETSLQSAVYDRLFNLPENIYKKYETSDLVERAISIPNIISCVYENIFVSVLSVFFSSIYLFMMFAYSSELSIIGIVMITVHSLIVFILGFIATRYEKEIIKLRKDARVVLHQTLSGIAKIKMAYAENKMMLQYQRPNIEAQKSLAKKTRVTMVSGSLNMFFKVLYSIVFYYKIAYNDLNLDVGSFLAFTAAFGVFSTAALQLVENVLKWQQLQPTIEKAKLLFETGPEREEDIQLVGRVRGKVEMSNVSFRYNENEDLVLSDISFTINKGEYIGIVGSSGSGKSTLLRLLMGFDKPTSGKIYYDDKDMDLLDKRELRKSFGVVLQDGQLIAGSIYENIVLVSSAMTKEEGAAELEKLWQIIKKVGLEKDIVQMPMGTQTMVSEGAGTISGGQRQRILIARSLFNNPSILYFDEATSALDNRTQAIVSESLKEINATRVVIAHRLSTIKDCDRIIVMDKGRLVEVGTYDELMKNKGYYYRMALRQIA